ncbi:AAA family ATPase [Nocardioides sp. W7]|uniref:AAA family ATPase n=1 Tax=Nocardioides sp. W7 TaxID=2931390 RepID=UPI001FD48C25|nr:AAA family ATPase [Nocardioides sp. W7]
MTGGTTAGRVAGYPLWLRDLDATLPVTAQYVLHGNIRDRHLLPPRAGSDAPHPRLMDTVGAIWACLEQSDFDLLLHHSPMTGLTARPASPESDAAARRLLDGSGVSAGGPASYAQLAEVVRRVAGSRDVRCALVVDYVAQNRPTGEPPEDDLHQLMLISLGQVHGGVGHVRPGARRGAIYNPVLWLVDLPGDLPSWMVSGSDGIRQIALPLPDLDSRLAAARALAPAMPQSRAAAGAEPGDPVAQAALSQRFAETTEGMTLRGMMEVVSLATDAAPAVGGGQPPPIEASVQAYRLGLLENPWQRPELRRRIAEGEARLNGRVKGQPQAVRHAVDILVRSSMGLTAAHRTGPGGGPRGVLFFAGPTGVGKTELAKAITTLVFGDERAYIRFDMSEFSAEGSDARLIGSPPGYVGHGSGGELTNGVRSRPFSLVLFDEIEKAHPRILDKFLQILSDGRLTDGSGGTVHFSETIIVFTSNLGVRDVDPAATGPAFESAVKENVEREFRERLNRPELLGRIGDNVVVFDYLTREVAHEILASVLPRVQERVLAQHGVVLELAPEVRGRLFDVCTEDLSLGGRGVLDALEKALVNPLARALIGRDAVAGSTVVAVDVDEAGEVRFS